MDRNGDPLLVDWPMHRMRPLRIVQLRITWVWNASTTLTGKGSRRDTTICACSNVYIALDTSPQTQNFQTGQPVELEDQCRESSGKDRNFPYDYDIPWLNRDVIQPRLLQIPAVLFPPFTIWHIGTSSSFVRATPRQCQGQWEELACNLGTSDVENKPISCKSMLRGLI